MDENLDYSLPDSQLIRSVQTYECKCTYIFKLGVVLRIIVTFLCFFSLLHVINLQKLVIFIYCLPVHIRSRTLKHAKCCFSKYMHHVFVISMLLLLMFLLLLQQQAR